MRILIVHAWLTGNLGDVMQTSVLVRHLRELGPDALDISGWPPDWQRSACRPIAEASDRVLAEEKYPGAGRRPTGRPAEWAAERRWKKSRRELFRHYDVILAAPGPYVSTGDRRRLSALYDIDLARRLGKPFALSSHSVGPLGEAEVRRLARADLIVAREPATHEFLSSLGVGSHAAADYAFLFPLDATGGGAGAESRFGRGYCAVFLRANNLDLDRVEFVDGALRCGDLELVPGTHDRIVLATSDPGKDSARLGRLALRLGLPFAACHDLPSLVALLGPASLVVSDRYHPLVCAVSLGRPVRILPLGVGVKMEGLRLLLGRCDLGEIRELARGALDRVARFVLSV